MGSGLTTIVQFLGRLTGSNPGGDRTDAELVTRFALDRNETAFATLVQRHGPLVWGVCRRVLKGEHAAEDAFQATFLVLARKAGSIQKHGSLPSWLHGVALKTALRAKANSSKRREKEGQVVDREQLDPTTEIVWRDLRPILDEEVSQLPEKFRAPFVLCHLQGKSQETAAQELGRTVGYVSGQIARAKDWLRQRLTRRGVSLTAGMLTLCLEQYAGATTMPQPLGSLTVQAAAEYAAGHAAAGAISSQAVDLAQGVLNTMLLTKWKMAAVALMGIILLGAGVGLGIVAMGGATPGDAADQLAKEKAGESGSDRGSNKDKGTKPSSNAPQASKFALIIGANDYDSARLPKLRYAENDAIGMAGPLREGEWSTVVLTGNQSNIATIRSELDKLVQRRKKGDMVLLAFAGHGVTLPGPNGNISYFCPKDADLTRPGETLLSLTEVYDRFTECGADYKFLFSDACRSMLENNRGIDKFPPPPARTAVLFSCTSGQVALEHPKLKHGVFFHHVIEALKATKDAESRLVTYGDLRSHVMKQVPTWAKTHASGALQTPTETAGEWPGDPTLIAIAKQSTPLPPVAAKKKAPEQLLAAFADWKNVRFDYATVEDARIHWETPADKVDDKSLPVVHLYENGDDVLARLPDPGIPFGLVLNGPPDRQGAPLPNAPSNRISRIGLEHLHKHPNLHALFLCLTSFDKESDLKPLGSLSSLRWLTLFGSSGGAPHHRSISGEILGSLRNLQVLELSGAMIDNKSALPLATLPRLTHFHGSSDDSADLCKAIGANPNIVHFQTGAWLTDEACAGLAKLPSKAKLTLNVGDNNSVPAAIKALTCEVRLRFSSTNRLDADTWNAVASISNLTELTIAGNVELPKDFEKTMPKVRKVIFPATLVESVQIRRLVEVFPNVEELTLNFSTALQIDDFAALAGLQRLRVLSLDNFYPKQGHFAVLSKMAALKRLAVLPPPYDFFSDFSGKALQGLTEGSTIEDLTLGIMSDSDDGLAAISKLSRLRHFTAGIVFNVKTETEDSRKRQLENYQQARPTVQFNFHLIRSDALLQRPTTMPKIN